MVPEQLTDIGSEGFFENCCTCNLWTLSIDERGKRLPLFNFRTCKISLCVWSSSFQSSYWCPPRKINHLFYDRAMRGIYLQIYLFVIYIFFSL